MPVDQYVKITGFNVQAGYPSELADMFNGIHRMMEHSNCRIGTQILSPSLGFIYVDLRIGNPSVLNVIYDGGINFDDREWSQATVPPFNCEASMTWDSGDLVAAGIGLGTVFDLSSTVVEWNAGDAEPNLFPVLAAGNGWYANPGSITFYPDQTLRHNFGSEVANAVLKNQVNLINGHTYQMFLLPCGNGVPSGGPPFLQWDLTDPDAGTIQSPDLADEYKGFRYTFKPTVSGLHWVGVNFDRGSEYYVQRLKIYDLSV
jgi:hypothetical protein